MRDSRKKPGLMSTAAGAGLLSMLYAFGESGSDLSCKKIAGCWSIVGLGVRRRVSALSGADVLESSDGLRDLRVSDLSPGLSVVGEVTSSI